MSQKYVLVHFIDAGSVAPEFSAADWPLHVTLLANFTIAEPVESLDAALSDLALNTKLFTCVAGGEALFGPAQNVAVSLIEPNENIRSLHDALSSIATRLGATFDAPTFMGDGYRPHATIQAAARLRDNQVLSLDSFTLVDMFPGEHIGMRKIIKTYMLAG